MSPVQINNTITGVEAPSTGRVLRQAQNASGVLRQAQNDHGNILRQAQNAGVEAPSTGAILRQAQNAQGDFAGALQAEVLKQAPVRGATAPLPKAGAVAPPVKISAHAAKRLAERNIEFSANDQARLEKAVDRIDSKGADKSLVLMDDLALLVSARNRVVITAVDSASAKDGVFTNIDSAVII